MPVTGAFPIAHVLSSFGMGGQERVALDLAAAHKALGHPVIAVSLAPPPGGYLCEAFEAAGIPTFSIGRGTGEGVDPGLSVRLARLLRRYGIGIVHTHNPRPLIYAPWSARLCGARVIHTKHGRNPSGAANLMARRLSALLVDRFVCVSEITARQARSRYECLPWTMDVILNGINLSTFREPREAGRAFRDELGIPPDAVVVGSVGRVDRNKNHALLVRAVAPLVTDASGGCHAVVIGEGPERPRLEDMVCELGLSKRVHVVGPRSDVPRALTAFDVFVLSSDSEGLPLVLGEAMACALPVVATSVGGIPDVLTNESCGILVPPGDPSALRAAIERLVRCDALRTSMGAAARERAYERLSMEHMAGRYLEIYHDAIS